MPLRQLSCAVEVIRLYTRIKSKERIERRCRLFLDTARDIRGLDESSIVGIMERCGFEALHPTGQTLEELQGLHPGAPFFKQEFPHGCWAFMILRMASRWVLHGVVYSGGQCIDTNSNGEWFPAHTFNRRVRVETVIYFRPISGSGHAV